MSKRILLVEDNKSNRKFIGDLIRREGYQLIEVETADEAISLCLTETFDLILMDIQLPGTDGNTATRILRSNEKSKNIPIMALTAHAMHGDEKKILAHGYNSYMAKPIAYKKFLEEVRRLIGESEQNSKIG